VMAGEPGPPAGRDVAASTMTDRYRQLPHA
jgi:hypothetical protein